jgi:hypothetical protein
MMTMRTPTQISNLRTALYPMIGPMAAIFSDEVIDEFANRFQKRIDGIPHHWAIRVRSIEEKDTEWDNIIKEEKMPYVSLLSLIQSCQQLLEKYPKIQAIMICPIDLKTGTESLSDMHIISREL